jgi:hypothetical protein
MILFPYAEDLEYIEDTLSFTMKFFNDKVTTNVQVSLPVDDSLKMIMDDLLDDDEGFEENGLWND